MPPYPTPAGHSNPTDEFQLTPPSRRTRKDLASWVTRAVASILPWARDLRFRLGRVKERNPHHDHGQHFDERWARERRLAGNLRLFQKIKGGMLATRLPGKLHLSALALAREAERLLHAGEWWQTRTYVSRRTGEVRETIYLPEDTWSAESALDYAVSFLARLVAAAWGMTEKTTPRYRPGEPAKGTERRKGASDGAWLAELTLKWGSRGEGGQSPLPATS